MKLYFVRHGRTNFNRWGIANDDPSVNVRLTKKGVLQAKSAAQKLKNVPLTHIFTSQLPRTQHTAAIINEYHSLEPKVDKRLNDNRTGFGGWPWLVVAVAYLFSRDKYNVRLRDGESLLDSKKRVTAFLEELKVEQSDADVVLVVGHANTGEIINGYVNNLSNFKTFTSVIRNGEVMEFDI